MELNEMEKRLIFQTEGYGKSDVTYELRMCLPYIPDPVKRKTAAELMRKRTPCRKKTVWRSFRIFGKTTGFRQGLRRWGNYWQRSGRNPVRRN